MEKLLEIKKSILNACLWLQKKGLIIGTWGNVSVRCDDAMIITPSRINYNVMKPEDMMVLDLEGNIIDGYNCPSSEKDVHRLIYKYREDVDAVVHCHSEYATAMSATGCKIPPIVEELCQLIGGEIPCTNIYIPAEKHLELAKEVAISIGDKNAVLIRNHGPVCCGRNLDEALLACLVVEKVAKIYMHLNRRLEAIPIIDEYVKSERYRFVYKYGSEK